MNPIIRTLLIQLVFLTFALAHPFSKTTFENPPTQETRPNVLFVGNSLTFWSGGLPEALTDLTTALKIKASFQEHTIGGRSFYQYVDSADLETILKMGLWDFVVLQGNSVEALPEDNKFKGFGPSLVALNGKIKKYNPSCNVILFSTVAHKDELGRTEEIYKNYKKVGDEIGATVVPVGQAWIKFAPAGGKGDEADFLFADKKHPSAYGKMLNVYMFYGALFKGNPEELTIPTPAYGKKELDEKIIKSLKAAAQQTLIDFKLIHKPN